MDHQDDQDEPDEYEGEHEAPGRRHELRRKGDQIAYTAADGGKVIVISPKMMATAWGILAAIVPAAAAVVFWLGGQILSPRAAIEGVRKEAAQALDSLTAVAARNYQANRTMIEAMGDRLTIVEVIQRDQQERINVNTYLNCVTVRYLDGRLEPPECTDKDVKRYRPSGTGQK